MPRRRGVPVRTTSTTTRPARWRARSRRRASVAPVRSASRARASSGSSRRASSKAASSSCPTSGETSSKPGWRASDWREVVRRAASATAASASSPSRVRSSSLRRSSARTPPGRGVRLFPGRRSPGSPGSRRRPAGSFADSPSASGSSVSAGWAAHSSRMTSSAGRPEPSRTRMRPESAARAASRPDALVGRGQPPQLGELLGQQGEVDGAAHRRADPHVGVLAGGAHHGDGPPPERARAGGRGLAGHDLGLLGGVLVAHRHPAHPVVDGRGDAGGADGVERVHGGHDPEARARPRPARGGARAAPARSWR